MKRCNFIVLWGEELHCEKKAQKKYRTFLVRHFVHPSVLYPFSVIFCRKAYRNRREYVQTFCTLSAYSIFCAFFVLQRGHFSSEHGDIDGDEISDSWRDALIKEENRDFQKGVGRGAAVARAAGGLDHVKHIRAPVLLRTQIASSRYLVYSTRPSVTHSPATRPSPVQTPTNRGESE